ncbi:MAG: FRG domain-containing protein [Chloroflexi bacterium]|nr:FRG domain-containing protein [Chloroflexota bacterium]
MSENNDWLKAITVDCKSAKRFVRELDELHTRWGDSKWIFRGQNSDAEDWKLHPSAMRNTMITDFVNEHFEYWYDRNHLDDPNRSNWENKSDEAFQRHIEIALHVTVEVCLVWTFETLADEVGLPVPEVRSSSWEGVYGWSTHDTMKFLLNFHSGAFSPERISHYPGKTVYGFAQHHGIPTRLLDWTFKPLVAAFFAAYAKIPAGAQPDRVVVWAIKLDDLKTTSLDLVRHLYGNMAFPYAQAGVWLYDGKADDKYYEFGAYQPFENELAKIPDSGVYKLTLPYSKKDDLLKLLLRKGVFKSSLMPFLDNVAEDIMNKAIDWQEYQRKIIYHRVL